MGGGGGGKKERWRPKWEKYPIRVFVYWFVFIGNWTFYNRLYFEYDHIQSDQSGKSSVQSDQSGKSNALRVCYEIATDLCYNGGLEGAISWP